MEVYFLYNGSYNPIYDDNEEIITYNDPVEARDHAKKLNCYYLGITISDLINLYCNVQQTLYYIGSNKFHNDNSVNISDIFHRLQGK